jgi:hypothetical protein
MKKPAAASRKRERIVPTRKSAPAKIGKIHPIVVYPFKPADNYSDLNSLYQLVERLDADKERYAKPITVMDRKTHYAMNGDTKFHNFRRNVVGKHSDIMDVWCVDTCQMWYSGLGAAFESGSSDDVYWLIPGDFDYGTPVGCEVLGRLHDLPEIVLELGEDLCIGEIETDHNNPKQLIDTYGTFALLYNWFPQEAEEIREFTERPRSEFFAVRHSFLEQMLAQRWYAYEQTVVMLLEAVFRKKRISRFFVGSISDLPQQEETVSSALQQVERTERVLKALWRDRNESKNGWLEKYRLLETQSEQVRRSALTIFQNLLS